MTSLKTLVRAFPSPEIVVGLRSQRELCRRVVRGLSTPLSTGRTLDLLTDHARSSVELALRGDWSTTCFDESAQVKTKFVASSLQFSQVASKIEALQLEDRLGSSDFVDFVDVAVCD